MKYLFTIVATVLLFNFSSAVAQDNKAKKILDDVVEKIESFNSMKIQFDYIMKNEAEGINEIFKGSLTSSKNMFNLKVAGQVIITNGETLWTYIPDIEEVQISTLDNSNGSMNPTEMLKNYADNFNVKLISSNANTSVIELLPKKEAKFKHAEVVINNKTNLFSSFIISDEIGNKFIYKVNELIPNIALKANKFTFTKKDYPNVDFIDMR
ncbi:MAG: outer membrane lipoprotein carrier protein LolA [Bacteroidota bacterium]|nr:outer membrane lipoprotein carrier protein LolA [Bacteroidota bacterium]